MRQDGSLGQCSCGRDAAYASTLECTKCYKRRMAKRPTTYCSGCKLRKATYATEGVCAQCRAKRIAGYGDIICKVEECSQPLYLKAPLRGYCRSHWEEHLREALKPSTWPSSPSERDIQMWAKAQAKKQKLNSFADYLADAEAAFLEDTHYAVIIAEAARRHAEPIDQY